MIVPAAPREPAPPLLDDVTMLLEAEQHEAHVAARKADALGELGRRETGLVLEHAADETDAVEDAERHDARQGLRLRRARGCVTTEALCAGSDRRRHERSSFPGTRQTMHGLRRGLNLLAYSPTESTRNEMRTCARHSPSP